MLHALRQGAWRVSRQSARWTPPGAGIVVNALGGLDNPNAPASVSASGQLVQTAGQLSIDPRALEEAKASGLTAVNITLGYTSGDADPYEFTLDELDVWDDVIDAHTQDLLHVRAPEDIEAAHAHGKIGVIYGFQNAAMFGDQAARATVFRDRGVRVVQLTYNGPNQLGDGCMASDNRGLSDFGREVIAELNANHLMVDLSHSGEATCLDAIAASSHPISINHTGCRALVDLPRNKTDAELRAVAESGGFVGIYFMPFLNTTGHATADDVVAHIDHAVNVCGIDHVGIGTDGDVTAIDDLAAYRVRLAEHVAHRRETGAGATGERADTLPFVLDLRGVTQFRDLAQRLDTRGYDESAVEKILGLNFVEYAREVWKPQSAF